MTIFLLFLAALLEGADIVSMGLAAPAVAKAYGFGPGEMSYILTAAIVGLMGGAAVGGRLGDLFGRKRVLLAAFFGLAVFSLATALASDLGQFITVRLLCGLGLGAAFPNLIALASEASRAGRKSTGVGLMFAGQPIGGTLLALFIASQAGELDWRVIFYIGGGLPLLLLPVLFFALPESAVFKNAKAAVAGMAVVLRPRPAAPQASPRPCGPSLACRFQPGPAPARRWPRPTSSPPSPTPRSRSSRAPGSRRARTSIWWAPASPGRWTTRDIAALRSVVFTVKRGKVFAREDYRPATPL